jgi:undecaprenyl-diphosphatase
MIELLVEYDTRVFEFLNEKLANPVFDFTMPIITNDWVLRIALAIVLLLLLILGRKQERMAVVLVLVAIAIADQLSSSLLKHLVERVRPCHVVQGVHLLVDCGQGFSFPSSHAANSFAVATTFAILLRKYKLLLFVVAVIVSYSRIAVGVHYPIDVLCGAVVGLLSGVAVCITYNFIKNKLSIWQKAGQTK